MKRRELLGLGVAVLVGGIPSSSAEPIRRDQVSVVIPSAVSAFARNVEDMSNDTILRAGSVLFYGTNSRFPDQGALIKDQGRYYVMGIRHAISSLGLREHKMGIYIPFAGNLVEDSRRMSLNLSHAQTRDDILALLLPTKYQERLKILEDFHFIQALEFRRESPQVGQMVAIPNPETASYSYHRITDINLGLFSLLPDRRYANPPLCQGQSGAPILYIDESGSESRLTNQVIGAHAHAINQFTDVYGRLCSTSATIGQLHNRFSGS